MSVGNFKSRKLQPKDKAKEFGETLVQLFDKNEENNKSGFKTEGQVIRDYVNPETNKIYKSDC